MNPLERLAEERLKEAIEAGAFDELAGLGRPLRLEDLSRVPEELRAGYLLLKGSGHLPEEMQLKKEMLKLGDLLRAARGDSPEVRELEQRRNAVALRFRLLMERRGATAWTDYATALNRRLG